MPNMVFTPADGEPRTYEIVLEDFLWAEIRAIQKVTGASGLVAIGDQLEAADGAIIPAMLWVMRKREEPTLTFKDLDDLRIRQISLEPTEAEKKKAEEDAKEAESSQEIPQTSPPPVEPPPPAEESPSPQSQPMRLAT